MQVGIKIPPPGGVVGLLLPKLAVMVAAVVGTGLKLDGLVPMTGMVAVGVNEKMGAGNAMLKRGRDDRSTLAGGER